MGLKRKRSLTAITSSPASSTTSTLVDFSSPPHTHHISLFTPSQGQSQHGNSTYSPPEPYFAAGMAQSSSPMPTSDIPKHLHSRTRKRFRDDRPDEGTIARKTINLLFDAQRELRYKEMDSGYNTPDPAWLTDFPNVERDDEVMNHDNEIDVDNAIIESAPVTSADEGLRQAPLPFSIMNEDHRNRRRTPSFASSVATSTLSPLSQPKHLQQRSLHSFFGGGRGPSGSQEVAMQMD